MGTLLDLEDGLRTKIVALVLVPKRSGLDLRPLALAMALALMPWPKSLLQSLTC